MKNFLLYIVSLITCLYFLSAGNVSLFSKFKKSNATEFADMDEDSADKEDKTETDDSKEDNCKEENFLNQSHLLLPVKFIVNYGIAFSETTFFLPQRVLEISSPPPKV